MDRRSHCHTRRTTSGRAGFVSELERITGSGGNNQLPRRVGAYLGFSGSAMSVLVAAIFNVPPLIVIMTAVSVTVGTRAFEFLLSGMKRAERFSGRGVGDGWRTLVLYGVFLTLIAAQILAVRDIGLWWAALIALPAYFIEALLARERLPTRFRSK